jgi:hypothetical protein
MSFFGFKQTDRKIVNTWKICREISSTHEEQETCSPQPGRCSTLTIVMIVIIIITITITIITSSSHSDYHDIKIRHPL